MLCCPAWSLSVTSCTGAPCVVVDALQAEYTAQGTEGPSSAAGRIVLLPTVIINDKQYRGRLDAVSITKALCAGFEESTEPEVLFPPA